MSSPVMIQNLGKQREIFDGGLDEQGVRQTLQLDPQGIGVVPEWAASLPVLHRAVARKRIQVVAGTLPEAKAPRVEVAAPTPAPSTLADVIAALRALPADQRAHLAAELLQG